MLNIDLFSISKHLENTKKNCINENANGSADYLTVHTHWDRSRIKNKNKSNNWNRIKIYSWNEYKWLLK